MVGCFGAAAACLCVPPRPADCHCRSPSCRRSPHGASCAPIASHFPCRSGAASHWIRSCRRRSGRRCRLCCCCRCGACCRCAAGAVHGRVARISLLVQAMGHDPCCCLLSTVLIFSPAAQSMGQKFREQFRDRIMRDVRGGRGRGGSMCGARGALFVLPAATTQPQGSGAGGCGHGSAQAPAGALPPPSPPTPHLPPSHSHPRAAAEAPDGAAPAERQPLRVLHPRGGVCGAGVH